MRGPAKITEICSFKKVSLFSWNVAGNLLLCIMGYFNTAILGKAEVLHWMNFRFSEHCCSAYSILPTLLEAMAQGVNFYEKVKKELECSICQEQFCKDNEPKVLKCLHTFCNICLEAWLRKQRAGELSCPTCRQITECPDNSIKNLPSNLFYKQMLEIVEAFSGQGLEDLPHCGNCDETENRRSSRRNLQGM